jgi:hypothetical protein
VTKTLDIQTSIDNGYLGSRNDEERSETRYVLRIAEFSESSNFRTHTALQGFLGACLVQCLISTLSLGEEHVS